MAMVRETLTPTRNSVRTVPTIGQLLPEFVEGTVVGTQLALVYDWDVSSVRPGWAALRRVHAKDSRCRDRWYLPLGIFSSLSLEHGCFFNRIVDH